MIQSASKTYQFNDNMLYHNNMKPNIISELDHVTDYLFRKLLT